MRILHVISEFEPRSGGAAVAMLNTASAQRLAGLEIEIFATSRSETESPEANRLRDQGYRVEILTGATRRLNGHHHLGRAIQSAVERAEVVHVHGLWEQAQYMALEAADRLDTPACLSPHGMLTGWSLSQKRLKKSLYLWARLKGLLGRCPAVHFTTEWERDGTAARYRGRREAVIPLSINTDTIKAAAANPGSCPPHLLPHADTPTVAFLGRLYPGKGAEHLVAAWPHVKTPGARLLLIGPEQGGLADALKTESAARADGERIDFCGPVYPPELFALLGAATLFCLPSDHENFGLAAAEAMASGTATLLSSEVAMGTAAVAAGAAAVVSREPEALAQAIDHWLGDAEARNQLAQRAQSYAAEALSHAAVGAAWTGLYQTLVSAHP